MDRESVKFSLPTVHINVKKLLMTPEKRYRGTHFHNEVELFRVNSGQVRCEFSTGEVVINEGECLLINSRILHTFTCMSDMASVIYIQADMDEYIQHLLPNTEGYLPMFINRLKSKKYEIYENGSEFSEIIENIESEAENQLPNFDCYIKSNLYHLAAFMCRNKFLAAKYDENNISLSKVMPVIKYIEQNYSKELSLNEMCEVINVSKYYLCKLFKKATGITTAEYVNLFRLYHTESMLINTQQNIAEIAFACGFTSIQHFNKMFKKYKSCTPKEYRSMYNKM